MFKIPRVNVIESDEGFSVEVLGRTGLTYTEGGKSLFVDSEVLAQGEIAIWRNSIKSWTSSHDIEIIDTAKRNEIVKNIIRAFAWRNVNISFFDP